MEESYKHPHSGRTNRGLYTGQGLYENNNRF